MRAASLHARAVPRTVDISKTYPGVVALDHVDLVGVARRGDRADRRERRRQIDADARARRRRRAERRRHPDRRRRTALADGRGRDQGGHRLRPPGAQSLRQSRCRRQRLYRPRAGLWRAAETDRPQTAPRPGAAAARASRRRFRARCAACRIVAGPASARRDHQGAVARCAPCHHGRADLQPDPDRDRPPDAGHRGPQGRGRQHHLHHASPERGDAMRRSRRGVARRTRGRRARRAPNFRRPR